MIERIPSVSMPAQVPAQDQTQRRGVSGAGHVHPRHPVRGARGPVRDAVVCSLPTQDLAVGRQPHHQGVPGLAGMHGHPVPGLGTQSLETQYVEVFCFFKFANHITFSCDSYGCPVCSSMRTSYNVTNGV